MKQFTYPILVIQIISLVKDYHLSKTTNSSRNVVAISKSNGSKSNGSKSNGMPIKVIDKQELPQEFVRSVGKLQCHVYSNTMTMCTYTMSTCILLSYKLLLNLFNILPGGLRCESHFLVDSFYTQAFLVEHLPNYAVRRIRHVESFVFAKFNSSAIKIIVLMY